MSLSPRQRSPCPCTGAKWQLVHCFYVSLVSGCWDSWAMIITETQISIQRSFRFGNWLLWQPPFVWYVITAHRSDITFNPNSLLFWFFRLYLPKENYFCWSLIVAFDGMDVFTRKITPFSFPWKGAKWKIKTQSPFVFCHPLFVFSFWFCHLLSFIIILVAVVYIYICFV